jgi:hypothetical protein
MMMLEQRIAAWVAAVPGAISGQGGHNQTFLVACRLYNGWALSEPDVLRWLVRYNEKCEPPWTPAELKHKAASAVKARHKKCRGHMLREEDPPTQPAPIRLPPKDTRLPVEGKLASQGDVRQVRLISTPRHISKTKLKPICETCKKGVPGVPKNARKLDEKSEKGVAGVPGELTPVQPAEAQRIASELLKLYHVGAISGPDDPEAVFYAHVIRAFGGACTGALNSEQNSNDSERNSDDSEQNSCATVLEPAPGLSPQERMEFYTDDLAATIGEEYIDHDYQPPVFHARTSSPEKETVKKRPPSPPETDILFASAPRP